MNAYKERNFSEVVSEVADNSLLSTCAALLKHAADAPLGYANPLSIQVLRETLKAIDALNRARYNVYTLVSIIETKI
jgi:hypothetical protein